MMTVHLHTVLVSAVYGMVSSLDNIVRYLSNSLCILNYFYHTFLVTCCYDTIRD